MSKPVSQAASSDAMSAARSAYDNAVDEARGLLNTNALDAGQRADITQRLSALGDTFDTTLDAQVSGGPIGRTRAAGRRLTDLVSDVDAFVNSLYADFGSGGMSHAAGGGLSGPGGLGGRGALDITDGRSMQRMMESSPDDFGDWWRGLSTEDRQLASMNLQQHMQSEAQLASLLSNVQQSTHNAAMAIARNLAA